MKQDIVGQDVIGKTICGLIYSIRRSEEHVAEHIQTRNGFLQDRMKNEGVHTALDFRLTVYFLYIIFNTSIRKCQGHNYRRILFHYESDL